MALKMTGAAGRALGKVQDKVLHWLGAFLQGAVTQDRLSGALFGLDDIVKFGTRSVSR